MSPKRNDKAFDCLQFKDRAQEEVYEEIKELTREQQVEYFRRSAEQGPLAEWWRRIRRRGHAPATLARRP